MRFLEFVKSTVKLLGAVIGMASCAVLFVWAIGPQERHDAIASNAALQRVRVAYEQGRCLDLPKDERGGWAATLCFEKGRPGDLTYANMQLIPEKK